MPFADIYIPKLLILSAMCQVETGYIRAMPSSLEWRNTILDFTFSFFHSLNPTAFSHEVLPRYSGQ